MAPTSLLARQHFNTIASFLANSSKARVKLSLLVGGAAKNERGIILSGISSGAIDILIATHSAFQKDVNFKDLGLVVIDEQHKFGVSQRSALVSKGVRPDTLVMTATPIPRSLALTVYGDLDVSVIDELPPGRKSVKTTAIVREGEPEAWAFVRKELTKGRQAYVVSPLVDESEKLDLKSATEAFEELNGGALYGYKLALLHGKMKRDEQSKVVDAFRRGDIDVLVSTVVIEVGVDIPNANTMVVLHAERFGLAQLHQLRGRIGRGSESGYFFLFNEAKTEDAQRRLAVLEQTSDGFKIAEEDLLIRGPGEFLGTRQHGLPEFKLMDIIRDLTTIREARKDAENILQKDCTLTSNDYCALGNELLRLVGKHGAEAGIG
jgi:ATP-dependent DNA helicase RecG